MAGEDDRRIAESLDPRSYVAHITETALLLKRIASDLEKLTDKRDEDAKEVRALREAHAATERDVAVFKVETKAEIKMNQEAIRDLVEGLKWLRRLVVGAVLAGVVSGLIALVFRAFGK